MPFLRWRGISAGADALWSAPTPNPLPDGEGAILRGLRPLHPNRGYRPEPYAITFLTDRNAFPVMERHFLYIDRAI